MFRNTKTASNNKPYCRACHNAGLSLEEYTNHWTRSSPGSGGVITCPLILASECGYCHNTGHWTKFCPVLMADDKAKVVSAAVSAAAAEVVVAATTKPVVAVISVRDKKNYFSALNEDEDSEEDEEEETVAAAAVPIVPVQSKVLDWKKALGMLDFEEVVGGGGNGIGGNGTKKVIDWKSALSRKADFPPLVVVGAEDCGDRLAAADDVVKKTPAETWASILTKSKPKSTPTPAMTVAVAPMVYMEDDCDDVKKPTFSFSTFKFTNWTDAVSDDEDE